MGRAVMIGGVFLLSRSPEALADWYRRHLGWELAFLPDEGYYTELYFREDDDTEQRQHLVFAIMPAIPATAKGTSSTTASRTSKPSVRGSVPIVDDGLHRTVIGRRR
jgi:catechol 2,3-dioxygenase-like lactoylglutathione lyase family enzyme